MLKLEALFEAFADVTELKLELGSLSTPFARACLLPQKSSWTQTNEIRIGRIEHINANLPNPTTLCDLTENEPAAIGYLLTKRDEKIPETVIKTAKNLGITLFSIPPTITANAIYNAVLKLNLKDNSSLIAQSQVLQEILTSLNDHRPQRTLLEKLHALTDGSFLLLASDNRTLASAGPLRIPKARLLTLAEGKYQLQIRSEMHTAFLFHVRSELRSSHNVFIAVIHDPAHLGIIENAIYLLSTVQEKQEAAIEKLNIQREAFLSEWFANSFDTISFKHQLRVMGFDEEASYAVVVVSLVTNTETKNHSQVASRQTVMKILEELQLVALSFFETVGLTALSSLRPRYQVATLDSNYNPHCIFVFSGADATAQLAQLNKTLATVDLTSNYRLQVGLSQESFDYNSTTVKSLYQQAQQASRQAQKEPVQFQTPEPLSWLLSNQSQDKLQSISESIIKSLHDQDKSGKLLETLLAYLENSGNLDHLAKQLNIHINTLRYRLSKIETLTAKSLSNPKHLAEFYVVSEIIKLDEST